MGTYFLEELLKVQQEFPDVVGDVRGKGLMIGVELVTDKVPDPASLVLYRSVRNQFWRAHPQGTSKITILAWPLGNLQSVSL